MHCIVVANVLYTYTNRERVHQERRVREEEGKRLVDMMQRQKVTDESKQARKDKLAAIKSKYSKRSV